MKIIDITVPLGQKTPCWPGQVPYRLRRTSSIGEGKRANVSVLEASVHTGTHVDAPFHFIDAGKTVESLDLRDLIGEASVINFTGFKEITADMLSRLPAFLIKPRMLFKTSNSAWWELEVSDFQADYTALTADAAQWLVDHKVKLVGIDYLSIQLFKDPPDVHYILLENEVVILEGLNLGKVREDVYDFICLPLKLEAADGAPARAVLIDRE